MNNWARVIDEALVSSFLGVFAVDDTYEEAGNKLNKLICWHIDVATDPKVNGGYKLVPLEPSEAAIRAACIRQADPPYDSYDEWVNSHSSEIVRKIRYLVAEDYRAMVNNI